MQHPRYVPKEKEVGARNFVAEPTADPKKRSRADLLAGMLKHLQPRETVQAALRRLGGGPAAAKQRRWQKQRAGGKPAATDKDQAPHDEAAFAELTACTDELLADGEFDVYSYSYEKVAYELREHEAKAAAAAEEDTSVAKFEYKVRRAKPSLVGRFWALF